VRPLETHDLPLCAGVYRLYAGTQLLHVGMAGGAATLRSEVECHTRGEYGARTQSADRVEWEVAPDALFAYRRFLALYAAATHAAPGVAANDEPAPSASRRLSASG
jgi:hypothetical protein